MSKKLIMSCMAVVALAAFALPATAMAENKPTLTSEGVSVPVGTKIVGTNVGETLFTTTSGTTLTSCNKVTMTGTVTRNDSGFVEGTITTKDFQGTGAVSADNNLPECTASFGNAYVTVEDNLCIRSTPAMLTDEFQVGADPAGGKCSEANGPVHFIIGSTTAGECTYTSTGIITGDYTTATPSQLTVRNTQSGSGAKLTKGGFFCPTSGMLKMTFSLETETGTPVGMSKLP